QAVDGIRCFHVTGVQTCALPIYHYIKLPATILYNDGMNLYGLYVCRDQESRLAVFENLKEIMSQFEREFSCKMVGGISLPHDDRSEERRVGTEGGARWGPVQDTG